MAALPPQPAAAAPDAAPADVDFQKDVVYGHAGGVDLKLNLARPRSAWLAR